MIVKLIVWNNQRNCFNDPGYWNSTVWSSTINCHWWYCFITYKRIQEARITKDNDGRFDVHFFFFSRRITVPIRLIHENCTNYIHLFVSPLDHLHILLFIKYNSQYYFHVWHNKLEKFQFSPVNCKNIMLLVKTRLYW